MAITLNSLPVEILDQICRSLPRHRDVSNFRLACHRLADVGLPALLPRLTVQLFPESLDRLCNIASDPILKHHVFIIVFVMDIFDPEDSTLDEWKDKLAEMAEDIHPHLDFDMLEDEEEMRSSWEGLRLLLSRQNEAFTALESPRVRDALQQFRNLNNLEVRYSKRQDRTSRDETYRKIYEAHPYIHKESQPFYPSYTGTTYAGRPGIKPLKALLRGIGKPGLRTLRVEALDAQFFNGNVAAEAAEFESLLGSLRDLNTLQLTVTHCAETVESAESGLSTDRFRTFLSAAPHLENIDVGFGDTDSISFYPKVANVLPVEYTWPNLTRLRLSVVEIVPPTFLDFLRRQRSLETLELGHCQLPEGSTHTWYDVFKPLAVEFNLKKLALSGTFRVKMPTRWDYIDMRDAVDDMELQVSEALEMVVCSKEFDAFLHSEVAMAMHDDMGMSAVKPGIILSLMGNPPPRTAEITMRIPTDYAHYFKAFALVTDSSNWGKGGMWVSGYERILRPVREAPEAPRF